LDLYRYYWTNDNLDITIMPMECGLKDKLNLTNIEKTEFEKICVNYAIDGKPIIYVNNALTYFNVSGKMTIKNLIFSGINGVATTTSTAAADISVLP
jgi:peptidyl-tRNA hydrolase